MAQRHIRAVFFACAVPLLANAAAAPDRSATPDLPPLVGPNIDIHDRTPLYLQAMSKARARTARTDTRSPAADLELGGWNEPTLAVNPTDPLNLAYASLGELRVSMDGGTTWQPPVPLAVPPNYTPGGDPSLAFDSGGRLFFSYIGLRLGSYLTFVGYDLLVAECDPATGAFLPGYPVNVTTQIGVPASAGNFNDKEWLAADTDPDSPFADRLYLVWTLFPPAGDEVTLSSWSSDHGLTWSPPLSLGPPGTGASVLWGVHVTVAPGGAVYAVHHRQTGLTNGVPDGVSGTVELFRSDDGAATFPLQSQPFGPGAADMTFNVQNAPSGQIPGTDFLLQGSTQPWVLADPMVAGRVYVVANDDPDNSFGVGDPADVFLATSTDSGATWSAPVRVDDGPGTSFQVMPTAHVDRDTGAIAIQYYDNRNGALNADGNFLLDVFQTVSTDGGATFGPDFQINDAPFDPNAGSGCRYGCGPWLNGVHAVASDAFAVADNGSLLDYHLGSWSSVGNAGARLFGVWASGVRDAFACGAAGKIVHFDGFVLATQSSGTTADLFGIAGTSGTDVWAVGASGTVLHYNGTSWSALAPPTSAELHEVWIGPTGNVFVAGDGGTVLRYDGAWTDISVGESHDLFGIWGLADDDLYVTSLDGGLQHWDGSLWTAVETGWPVIDDVWGSSATDIVTVSWGTIRRYDGTDWAQQNGSEEILVSVHGTASNNVFAVGSNAEIVHFDGAAWTRQDNPLTPSAPTLRIGEYMGVGAGLGRLNGVWCGNMFEAGDAIDQQSIFDWADVPGLTPGEAGSAGPLLLSRSGGDLVLEWGASDCAGSSYEVYRGDLNALHTSGYGHDTALTCATPATEWTVATNDPSLGAADYFLVVASVGSVEGSYGRDALGVERPPSAAACQASQDLASCARRPAVRPAR